MSLEIPAIWGEILTRWGPNLAAWATIIWMLWRHVMRPLGDTIVALLRLSGRVEHLTEALQQHVNDETPRLVRIETTLDAVLTRMNHIETEG